MWSSVYLLHGVLAVLFLVYQTEVSHQTSGVVLSGHSIPTLPESNKYIVNIRSKWFYTKVKYMYYISNITTENSSLLCSISSLDILKVQLFSTNAFSANTFSLNVLPSFTAIHLKIYCEYEQLLYILLSKKTITSNMTSDLLESN